MTHSEQIPSLKSSDLVPESKQEVAAQLPENYIMLKNRLLAGDLDPVDFRNILIQADQNTNDREASEDNYLLLKDPQVEHFLTNTEFRDGYFLLLSFTTLHCAQRLAMQEEGSTLAQKMFIEALSLKQKVSNPTEEDTAYLKATIAYFSGDTKRMEILKLKIDPNGTMKINIKVLERLINGLKEYGKPNYKRDYFGIEENA
jgi:hypothetical protein